MSFTDLRDKAEAEGTAYKTGNLLDDIDANFAQLTKNITKYTYQFSTSNLVSGVLSVNHALNTAYPKPLLIRPDGTFEDALAIMTKVDNNNVTFDFGGSIQAGTWNGLIEIGA